MSKVVVLMGSKSDFEVVNARDCLTLLPYSTIPILTLPSLSKIPSNK